MSAKVTFVWPRVLSGWLIGTACGVLAISLLMPLLPEVSAGWSMATLVAIVPGWMLTFPALVVRFMLGPEQTLAVAIGAGALFAMVYAMFTYELFLPLTHRMTAGPSLGVVVIYAVAGAIAGAAWLKVERRHGT